ncbi:glycosyltransferase [Microbacterium sp. TNHR37B]|uniref:glycosyltransferase n=1 Tax=Microbacterium sp. TNHR37B TaxID=1775956 RepID=UPI0007B28FBC|nr:glycosyltransferase [Microbacterium sp. TNHR37B]KZE89043.1 D-inositol-3-phosphate glycosyltransferase [Microbacterium sp. TNHR37B]
MTTTLRIVLERPLDGPGADLGEAARELARGLVATAPSGCDVEAIVPAGADDPSGLVPGLRVAPAPALARRELVTAWQLGLPTGVGGGLIHAPSLAAPLIRHDRVNDHDQTVVTMWDLDAWEHPGDIARATVVRERALLKRAVRHADAVVVPTHAMAERLVDIARLGDRIRVIAGAPAEGFRVPSDEVGRRRSLGLPEGFVLLSGSARASDRLAIGFAAIVAARADLPVVVIDGPEGEEPHIAELAAAAGVAEGRLHVRPALDVHDRGAVLGGAVAFLAPAAGSAFPWRLGEALRAGVPVAAIDTPVHREVLAEGGLLAADVDELAGALSQALGSAAAAERLAVLAADRGRAFSWLGAAERVWQLHADL